MPLVLNVDRAYLRHSELALLFSDHGKSRCVRYYGRKKSPAEAGLFVSGVLGDLNLISLHPFLAFGSHERDRLAFAQAFEACAFD